MKKPKLVWISVSLMALFFLFLEFNTNSVPQSSQSTQNISPVPYNIVFVSRQIQHYTEAAGYTFGAMPGAGPNTRFQVAAPGKLQMYSTSGVLTTLIDGSNPTPASLNILDVQGVDVSYDGTQLVFAGLSNTVYHVTKNKYDTIQYWRIYKMAVNGTGLTQITFTDTVINNAQFNSPPTATYNNFSLYQDGDPIWLPDGRICFSSTRYPSNSEYAGFRTSELWVVNNDGTGMHRITTERNGADRPAVDPLTGQIVFSRWWFNGRYPHDAMDSVLYPGGGYEVDNGLTMESDSQSRGANFISFNSWVSAEVNPDGTGLRMFAGSQGKTSANFMAYGGGLTSSGSLVCNYFQVNKLTKNAGFGGINIHPRGVGNFTAIDGYANGNSPTNAPTGTNDSLVSFYSTNGFATDVSVMPNNMLLYSWAPDFNQQYGIYMIDTTGHNKVLVYNNPGTTQLRPKAVVARPVPPVIADKASFVASTYPPLQNGPYNPDGNFTFKDFNVFFNGAVDMNITSAPAIGEVNSIRFYLNQQRTRNGSQAQFDWPILLAEMNIPLGGKIVNPTAPADVPLFEQLRSSHPLGYTVPTTGDPQPSSTAHVAGMNYSRPGATFTCVGCHRGHTMIPFPTDTTDIEYTNLAPGASVTVSNTQNNNLIPYITDRKVMLDTALGAFWTTPRKDTAGQWTKLTFPVPVKVKAVIPYNIPKGGHNASTIQVGAYQVNLYADANATILLDSIVVNSPLSSSGDTVNFNYVVATTVEVKILKSTGDYGGFPKTGLAEVEVIATNDTANAGQLRSLELPAGITVDNNQFTANIYPNPANDRATLNINTGQGGNLNYTVYALNGSMVTQKQVNIDAGTNNELIDLSGEQAGIYIITVTLNGQQKVFKLIKM